MGVQTTRRQRMLGLPPPTVSAASPAVSDGPAVVPAAAAAVFAATEVLQRLGGGGGGDARVTMLAAVFAVAGSQAADLLRRPGRCQQVLCLQGSLSPSQRVSQTPHASDNSRSRISLRYDSNSE